MCVCVIGSFSGYKPEGLGDLLSFYPMNIAKKRAYPIKHLLYHWRTCSPRAHCRSGGAASLWDLSPGVHIEKNVANPLAVVGFLKTRVFRICLYVYPKASCETNIVLIRNIDTLITELD